MSRKNRLRVWDLKGVRKIIPLARPLLLNVREARWQAGAAESRRNRLCRKPGRPSKANMIEAADLSREQDRYEHCLRSTLEELQRHGILCSDPTNTVGIFHFRVEHEAVGFRSAWFVYEAIGDALTWRYDDDPEGTKRDVRDLP